MNRILFYICEIRSFSRARPSSSWGQECFEVDGWLLNKVFDLRNFFESMHVSNESGSHTFREDVFEVV